MSEDEERVWAYIVRTRSESAWDIARECGVSLSLAKNCLNRISSENWRQPPNPRSYHVGSSDYSRHTIQPWDIWLEYRLNPWDADIIKRVLRNKPGQRREDYEKIKHVCDERIRQIDAGLDEEKDNAGMAQEEGSHSQVA